MAPRETENNTYAKFWGDKQRALWYVMIFSGVVNLVNISEKVSQVNQKIKFYNYSMTSEQCSTPCISHFIRILQTKKYSSPYILSFY